MQQPPPLRFRGGVRRFWIALAILALFFAIAVSLFYLEENRRGARAFAAVQKDLEAKGETLDWGRFIPPPIPDDQNMAMAPLFVREYQYKADPRTHVYTFDRLASRSKEWEEMPYPGSRPKGLAPSSWETAGHTDLPGWQRGYREQPGFPHSAQPQTPAAAVLLALTRYSPVLDELAQAATQRPLTRYPVAWDASNPFATPLVQYNPQQHFVQTLRLRATAHLANGEAEAALRDLELCWRLCGDMRRDPVLIAHLVEITCLGLAMSPVWEGLADRRWSAPELARLQADLQRFDLLTDYTAALRGERAGDLRAIDFIRDHGKMNDYLAASRPFEDTKNSWLGWFGSGVIPRGWFDFNKAIIARSMQDNFIEAVDVKAHRFLENKFQAGLRARAIWSRSPRTILAQLMLPIFDSLRRRDARLQTGLDEAVTACALERFFVDHQAYPARLDELVPGYLARVPTDVIDGAPLRYGLTPEGRYRLYGVGWNGRDDGGAIVRETSGRLKETEGDWVWQYAELPPLPPTGK